MRYDTFKSKLLPTEIHCFAKITPPKARKSNILSRGFIDIFENAKKNIFKNDDTSNEKRRGMKNTTKN